MLGKITSLAWAEESEQPLRTSSGHDRAPGVAGTSGVRMRPPGGRCGGRRREDQGVPWGHEKTANRMEGQAKGEE